MKTLRKCLLNEFSNMGDKSKTQMIESASDFFSKELNPYFSSIYGDRWILQAANREFTYQWVCHLVGINSEIAAKAINKMCIDSKAQFIPSPLEFRSLCISSEKAKRTSKLKIIRDEE